jgi:hypothetical protein
MVGPRKHAVILNGVPPKDPVEPPATSIRPLYVIGSGVSGGQAGAETHPVELPAMSIPFSLRLLLAD